MSSENAPQRVRSDRERGLLLVGGLAALMWVVEVIDLVAGDLDANGIQPREGDGLLGIFFAPFLHGDFGHLTGNTLPFLVLGGVIGLSGLVRVAKVTAIVVIGGGLGTWLFGPSDTVHIGASGVVFGYAAYLMTRAWYTRRMLHLLTGLLVLGVFGTTLLFGLVPTPGVSWQGHLFGALSGVLAARLLDGRRPERAPEPALA
jgi:membrane associated rhomboid family serine protease